MRDPGGPSVVDDNEKFRPAGSPDAADVNGPPFLFQHVRAPSDDPGESASDAEMATGAIGSLY
jgi:hypothetical protein